LLAEGLESMIRGGARSIVRCIRLSKNVIL